MRTRTVKPDSKNLRMVWSVIVQLENTSKAVSSKNIIDLIRENTNNRDYPPSNAYGVINWLHYRGYIDIAGIMDTTLLFKTTRMGVPSFVNVLQLGGPEHQRIKCELNEKAKAKKEKTKATTRNNLKLGK